MVLYAKDFMRNSPLLKILNPALPVSLLGLSTEPAPPIQHSPVLYALQSKSPKAYSCCDKDNPGPTCFWRKKKRRIQTKKGCGGESFPRCNHCLIHERDPKEGDCFPQLPFGNCLILIDVCSEINQYSSLAFCVDT